MKKIILFMVCLLAVAMLGCGHSQYSNKEADDAISKAIYEELGGEEVYYQGREDSADNIIIYEFLFYKEQDEQLEKIFNTVNKVIQQEEIHEKIIISCCIKIPGGIGNVLQLKNFCNKSAKEPDYITMQKLCICGSSITLDQESIYNNPATYSRLSGIKYLEISGELAKITEQENIDWYEYFPDLETLEVITEED